MAKIFNYLYKEVNIPTKMREKKYIFKLLNQLEMMRKLFHFCTFLLVCTFISSCSDNEDSPNLIPEGETTSINLTLNIVPVDNMGTPQTDERTSLDNFWLLEFNKEGKNIAITKELRFSIGSPENVEVVAGNDVKLVIVANTDKATVFQLGKLTYEQFTNSVYTTNITSANAIPFVGELTTNITKENQEEKISIAQIAAEVKYNVQHNDADGFTIKSITLKNVAKNMYYISKGESQQWDMANFQNLPSMTMENNPFTYYIGENQMGIDNSIQSAKEKLTEKPATYVEIIGEKNDGSTKETGTFIAYLGANDTNDFNIAPNHIYTYDITVDFSDQTDKRLTITSSPITGIAVESNCYMLSPDSKSNLMIPVKRVNSFWGSSEGNSNYSNVINDGTNNGKVKQWTARIIWKDTDKELFKFVNATGTSANDYIALAPSDGKAEGNALIGIYDSTNGEPGADAKPLWSWHIWVTTYNPGGDINGDIPTIAENPGKAKVTGGYVFRFGGVEFNLVANGAKDGSDQVMMDRNVGALSANPADKEKCIGMFYQYGRKDPFSVNPAAFYKDEDGMLGHETGFKTIDSQISKAVSVQNPDAYCKMTSIFVEDWLERGNGNDDLWYMKSSENKKTLYDPCPAGWRMPYKLETYDVISYNRTTCDYTSAENGLYLFKDKLDLFFPFAGHINSGSTKLHEYGHMGEYFLAAYWTPKNAAMMRIIPLENVDEDSDSPYAIYPKEAGSRSLGLQIRCIKE